jgi:hypothetical protein
MKKVLFVVLALIGFSTIANAQSFGVVFTANISNAAFGISKDLPFGVQLGGATSGLRLRASNLVISGSDIALTAQVDILISLFRIDPIEIYIGLGANGVLAFGGGQFGGILGAEGIVGIGLNVLENLVIFGEVNVVKYIIGVGALSGTNVSSVPLGIGFATGIALRF